MYSGADAGHARRKSTWADAVARMNNIKSAVDSRYELNAILDIFLSMSYPRYTNDRPANLKDVHEVLIALTSLVPHKYNLLEAKVCQFINLVVSTSGVMEGSTFASLLPFPVRVAKDTTYPSTVLDALRCINTLLYHNRQHLVEKHVEMLVGTPREQGPLLAVCSRREDPERCRVAIACIGWLGEGVPGCESLLSENCAAHCIAVTVRFLQLALLQPLGDPSAQAKFCSTCLRALQGLWPLSRNSGTEHAPSLITPLKNLLLKTNGSALTGGPQKEDPVRTALNFSTGLVSELHDQTQMEQSMRSGRRRGTHAPRRRHKRSHQRKHDNKNPKDSTTTDTESDSDTCSQAGPKSPSTVAQQVQMASPAPLVVRSIENRPPVAQATSSAISDHSDKNVMESAAEALQRGDFPCPPPQTAIGNSPRPPNHARARQFSLVSSQQGYSPAASLSGGYGSERFSRPTGLTSSDSDLSDVEGGHASSLRKQLGRQRELSLGLLHIIFKSLDKKTAFSFWPGLLPDSEQSRPDSLFGVLAVDPAPKLRLMLLGVIYSMLENSRSLLTAANDSLPKERHAFTALSQTLAGMVRELHLFLLDLLRYEKTAVTIVELHRCINHLAWGAPYHQLRRGYLTSIFETTAPHLITHNTNVLTTSLACLTTIMTVHAPFDEVLELFKSTQPPPNFKAAYHSAVRESLTPDSADDEAAFNWSTVIEKPSCKGPGITENFVDHLQAAGLLYKQGIKAASDILDSFTFPSSTPWIFRIVINILSLTRRELPDKSLVFKYKSPVRIEALEFLRAACFNYFNQVWHIWQSLFLLMMVVLCDPDEVVRVMVLKVIEILLHQLEERLQRTHDSDLSDMNCAWRFLFSGPLLEFLDVSCSKRVRGSATDCVCAVARASLAAIPDDLRTVIFSRIISATSEAEDSWLRSCSVRALGVLISHPFLRKDDKFWHLAVEDVLNSCTAQGLAVRNKGSWALANFCVFLVENKGGPILVADELLCSLIQVATKAAGDVDRVKSNAVRALGCLLHYTSRSSLERYPDLTSSIAAGIKVMAKACFTGVAKTRWNACYSFSEALRNAELLMSNSDWVHTTIQALLKAVQEAKNLKVRIGAAVALSIPTKRDFFGATPAFADVCTALLNGLEYCATVTNFSERHHKEALNLQIMCTLVHMVTLTTDEEAWRIHKVLSVKNDNLWQTVEDCLALKGVADSEKQRTHLTSSEVTNSTEDPTGTEEPQITALASKLECFQKGLSSLHVRHEQAFDTGRTDVAELCSIFIVR